jgi:rhamnulokinase
MEELFHHVLEGMKKCKEAGKIPFSTGIDTWGVDFVLTDKQGNPAAPVTAYRDKRTEGMDREVEKNISFEELYRITGVQKQQFNTIYQLMAIKKENPGLLEKAEKLFMIPDYFHYRLTNLESHEYTNATTTSLVDAVERDWSRSLIERLGFPAKLFPPLSLPGTDLGSLSAPVRQELGFDCRIILPATHDTGSAYLAVPAQGDDAVYLSSGTWSLMGIESPSPIISGKAREANFTNEGGYLFRYRFLKNIMGLWIIQSIKRELGNGYSFDALQAEAMAKESFDSVIDVNAGELFAPKSMIDAVTALCKKQSLKAPKTTGELMQCVYRSLARCYAKTVKELISITGKSYTALHVVGGGSKDGYLNRLTAKSCGIPVYSGPEECTVLGNLIAQMIAAGEFADIPEARKAVAESFPLKAEEP